MKNRIAGFCFKTGQKLKTDEISSIFSLKYRENGRFIRILFRKNQPQGPKLAIIVSKKIARRAVERNYCKRVIRELFRTHQNHAENTELVVQVMKKFSRDQFVKIACEFDLLLSKIVRRS